MDEEFLTVEQALAKAMQIVVDIAAEFDPSIGITIIGLGSDGSTFNMGIPQHSDASPFPPAQPGGEAAGSQPPKKKGEQEEK